MKRLIIIIVTMSFVFTNACSQRKWENGSILVGIGEFTALGKMFTAEAIVKNDTSAVLKYRIAATHIAPNLYYSTYTPRVYITCTPTMMDQLLKIAAKYKEWAEVAKNNKVGKFHKVIEIEYPLEMTTVMNNNEEQILKFETRKFTFNLYDLEKSPSIYSNTSFKVYGHTFNTGLAFNTPEEFYAFIDFLNPVKVIKRLKEGKTELFTQDVNGKKNNIMESPTKDNQKSDLSNNNTSNSNLKRIDKKEIASGALNKWKTAARKGSGIN